MKARKRLLAAEMICRDLNERDLPLGELESKHIMEFLKSGETLLLDGTTGIIQRMNKNAAI